VYDGEGLFDAGSRTGLFIFGDVTSGGGGGGGGGGSSVVDDFVDDVVSPAVFRLASNIVSVVVLCIIGVLCLAAFVTENVLRGVLLAVFTGLVLNFVVLFVLYPVYPGFLGAIEPFLLHFPALELANFAIETQTMLQVIVVSAIAVSSIIAVFVVSMRRD
jgi:hypothetical protein